MSLEIEIPAGLLGRNPEQLPHISLPDDYILTDHPLITHRSASIYTLPNHPDYLLRRHGLSPREISQTKHVYDLIATGLHHYDRMADCGLTVPDHRHIEASMPIASTEQEGRILSVMHYYPVKELRVTDPRHLPASLHTLSGLTMYAAHVLEDWQPAMFWDIFRQEQHGLIDADTEWPDTPQGAVVLDYGLVMDRTYLLSGGKRILSPKCSLAIRGLTAMALAVRKTAASTPFEDQALALRAFIERELPTPDDVRQ